MTTITQNERKNTDSKRKRSMNQSLFELLPTGKSLGFDHKLYEFL
jgi:hypothetical protein